MGWRKRSFRKWGRARYKKIMARGRGRGGAGPEAGGRLRVKILMIQIHGLKIEAM